MMHFSPNNNNKNQSLKSPSPVANNNNKSGIERMTSPSISNTQQQQQQTSTTTTMMMIPDSLLASQISDWLKRAQTAASKRDEAITRVSALVASGDQSASDLEDCVSSISRQHLPNLAPAIAAVATQVSASAKVAEGSFTKATTIDRSLTRVNRALDITRAVLKMRSSLQAMQTALNRSDIEAASAAVAEYDATSKKLQGRESMLMQYESSKNKDDESGSNSETSSQRGDSLDSSSIISSSNDKGNNNNSNNTGRAFVQDTRQKVHDAAMMQLERAKNELDEKSLRSCVTVLARLSYIDDAEKTFSDFMAKKNVAELNRMVDKKQLQEARTMRGASHLELVARLLDHTVGCLEDQEAFVKEYLGGRMRNFMLTIHNKSALLCVEVLKDFLDQRRLTNNSANSPNSRSNNNNNSTTASDPATIDQQLEDLARLLICCSTYFRYLTDRLMEEDASLSEKQAQQLVRTNNDLATSVENLMAIFVPLQIDYFDAAYSVAIADTYDLLNAFRKVFITRLSGASSSSSSTSSTSGNSTGFFQGIAAALGSSSSASSNNNNNNSNNSYNQSNNTNNYDSSSFINQDGSLSLPEVDAVNDIFYVCRNAILRVMNTKASAIASSTLIVINNLLSDKLLADCKRNVNESLTMMNPNFVASPTTGNSSSNNFYGAGNNNNNNKPMSNNAQTNALMGLLLALIWTGALHSISKDSKHLADETGKLAEKFFHENQDELIRFSEQRLDFVQTAATTDDIIDSLCKSIGNEMFKLCLGIRGDLRGVSFILERQSSNNNSNNNNNNVTASNSNNIAVVGDSAVITSSSSTSNGQESSSSAIWVEPLTERYLSILSYVLLPVAPWPEYVRCSVVSSFLDCVTIELEHALLQKRFDLAGALKLDQELRQLRNFFATGIDVDIPIRDKFKRLTAMCSVLLSERKADAAQASSNVLSGAEITNLLKLRVDPPL